MHSEIIKVNDKLIDFNMFDNDDDYSFLLEEYDDY